MQQESLTLSNRLEVHRALREQAFVVVEIDATRGRHLVGVSAQLRHQVGIIWHVMLNDECQILVTSESPISNIGSPDATPQSLKHTRHMFAEAAGDRLSAEEIETLLATIK